MIIKNLFSTIPKQILQTQLQNRLWFSKRKGLEQNIKENEIKKASENNLNPNPSSQSQENLLETAKLKFLHIQFLPTAMLLMPSLYNVFEMFDPTFLLGLTLAQKYSTLALMLNIDFKSASSLQILTGFNSIFTPFGMALVTILLPFKFTNIQEAYSELESDRVKNMSNLKAMHYEQVSQIEKSLKAFDSQNTELTEKNLTKEAI